MAENSYPSGDNEGRPSSGKSLNLNNPVAPLKLSVLPNQKKLKNYNDRFSFDVTIEELDAFKEGNCTNNTVKNTE